MRFTFVFTFLTTVLWLNMAVISALAQSYNDNVDIARPNVTFYPPAGSPTQALPPPPGSGDPRQGAMPAPVTPGDPTTSKPPVPTGQSTTVPQYGTYFQHDSQNIRSRVNLLVNRGTQTVNNTSVNRGTRVALTFQPDQLTDSQRGQVEGLIGNTPGNSGFTSFNNEPYQNITVSDSTLEEIEKILYPPAQPTGTTNPYPGTPVEGDTLRNTPWTDRSFIAEDQPATGYPRYESTNPKPNLRAPIREFCYWLVIAGAVFACMQLVFAGAMAAFGWPYAGSKAIAAAGGLVLLLMAFTIWKVDMTNALQARGIPPDRDSFNIGNPPVGATQQVQQSHGYVGDNTLPEDQKSDVSQYNMNPEANTPVTPAPGTGQKQPRSGLPLRPLGSAH